MASRLLGVGRSRVVAVVPVLLAAVLVGVAGDADPLGGLPSDRSGVELTQEAALVKAGRTGQPVPIPALTTETTEQVALPSGDIRATIAAGPVRMRRGDRWVPVDLTMVREPDGSVAPVAHPSGLRVSGAQAAGYERDAAGGLVVRDAAGGVLVQLPPLLMWDAQVGIAGSRPRTAAVASTVASTVGGLSLTLTPDVGWIRDRATVFPVTIDPTLMNPANTFDAYVWQEHTADYSGANDLRLGLLATSPPTSTRSYLNWDTSALVGKQITIARVYFFTFDSVSTDTVAYRYGFNTNPSPNTVAPVANGGDPASVTWLPEREGTNFVTVQAVDRAGLTSTIATCVFAVARQAAVGEWGLGETADATVAADNRNTHPATRAAGATFGVPGPGCQDIGEQCKVDRAVRLTGADDSFLATTSAGLVNTATGFSAAAWVRLSDTTRDHVAVSQDGSGEPGFTLGFDAATRKWTFGTPVSDVNTLGTWMVTSTAAATAGAWTHLVGVYDPVRKTMVLYVNGQAQGSAQRRSAWRSRGAVQIGRVVAKSGYTSGWAGDLADVGVFNRIIVPAEIAMLSTLLPVRQAYWQLNQAVGGSTPELGGGVALQLSGGAQIYAPDLTADPGAAPALVGAGHLVLDGVDDHAATQTPIVDTVGSFTVSLRAQVAAVPERPMVAISQAGVHTSGFMVRATPTRWELVLAASDTTGATAVTISDDRDLPTPSAFGQHLAVVFNAFTEEVRLYVDGQLAQTATGVHRGAWAATGGLQVGRALVDGAWIDPFSGVIDDVRVYSGVVDASTVALLAGMQEDPNL